MKFKYQAFKQNPRELKAVTSEKHSDRFTVLCPGPGTNLYGIVLDGFYDAEELRELLNKLDELNGVNLEYA